MWCALRRQSTFTLNLQQTFHKLVAWSMVFFTVVHIIAHMVNFARLAIETKTGFVGFLGAKSGLERSSQHRLIFRQLPHWTRCNWLGHDVGIGHHGLVRDGKTASRSL
jgi:hypothetical protein